MKKKILAAGLSVVFVFAAYLGFLFATRFSERSPEELRASYKAVYADYLDEGGSYDLENALRQSPVIVIASPVDKPKFICLDFYFKYRTVALKVSEVFRGSVQEKIINLSGPDWQTSYMETMKAGENYIFFMSPADYIGENQYLAGFRDIFYLSGSNQVVPFTDDEEYRKVLGITVDAFKEMIQEANPDS